MKNTKPYYLGLDIGTESVGWAVTDNQYNLLKANGKTLWGVRKFEGAKTAAERRVFRSARRRLMRRKQRIKLLQELFAAEICKVDPGFYERLKESKYHLEDRLIKQPNTLFNDPDFTDKDYFKAYPTIYHLRKALLEKNQKFDIRLIYLAVEHILKRRGHFLMEGQDISAVTDFKAVFDAMLSSLEDEMDMAVDVTDKDAIADILKSTSLKKTAKTRELKRYMMTERVELNEILALLSGRKVDLAKLFSGQSFEEAEVKKICFSEASFQDNYDKIADILQDRMYMIDKIKTVFDWAILANILQGEDSISVARVASYKKHKSDLKKLKRIIRQYGSSDEYNKMFKSATEKDNYCAYVGIAKKNNNKQPLPAKCSPEDFYKAVKKVLPKNSTDQIVLGVEKDIESQTFMPKQRMKDNSVVPYQIHMMELIQILANASKHYDFLNHISDGYSVQEKIVKIMKFRIPYYVGPLNDAHKDKGGNAWIVKKDTHQQIRPWNFEDVVDTKASAERFIRKMTNKCTYLVSEDVLPKNSILYSKYMVLNELNNLKINGELISVSLKQEIYQDLFMRYKKVTNKRLRDYLKSRGLLNAQTIISGIDGDFKATLSSLMEMRAVFINQYNEEEAENIIKWIVLFGEDKKMLRSKIEDAGYSVNKRVYSLRYSGWGRLSRKFLAGIYHIDKATGEAQSIITLLMETNQNLMQLLSKQYGFTEAIEQHNANMNNQDGEITYQLVEDLYVSPAVKRSIWQTLRIVEELRKVMKGDPEKIFVEMARSHDDKKRTISRKRQLQELYQSCKSEAAELWASLENKSDSQLRSRALYLYYKQLGRCMYTGEPIELGSIFNKQLYDLDHIHPQSKVKDDSISNLVLVNKKANEEKSDQYPVPGKFRQPALWKSLYSKGLISKVKYERLMRITPFSDDELAGFINRQLVETRQSTKAVATILNRVFADSALVYVKAGNVSDFRHDFDILKVRELNDYHHAQDAYLNIVVGNVYDVKFTRSPLNFIKANRGRSYNIKRLFESNVERGGNIAWKAGGGGTISLVKSNVIKNNVLVTRYASEGRGGLFDQNLMKKGQGQIPIKGSDERLHDIDKYGGYNKASTAYFFLVEHTLRKKRVRTIECVPLIYTGEIDSQEDLLQFCLKELKLQNPKILLQKIKLNALLSIDGFLAHLSGRFNDNLILKNAMQLHLNNKTAKYIKKTCSYITRDKEYFQNNGEHLNINENDLINATDNLKLYDIFLCKLRDTHYGVRLSKQVKDLSKRRTNFIELNVVDQCIVLGEILHFFQCNSIPANLLLVGGGKKAGLLTLGKNITNTNSVKIINQSVTGIFTNEIDLIKL